MIGSMLAAAAKIFKDFDTGINQCVAGSYAALSAPLLGSPYPDNLTVLLTS